MAGYTAVGATLDALQQFFTSRLPGFELDGSPAPTVRVIGSNNFLSQITSNMLGIYMHRITIDPHGRSRTFQQLGGELGAPEQELPVNLHLLLITSGSPALEASLISWAMLQLANQCHLGISHFQGLDDDWGEGEVLTVIPEEMTTEDLMRIWDTLDAPYATSVPYIARTVRLRLNEPHPGPPVNTRDFRLGTRGEAGNG